MTSEAYVFKQTAAERKRNGIGDYSKKRRGGRMVRLPSDNLTAKEWKKLNGEVTKYDMTRPVAWKDFKKWPRDIQIEYFKKIDELYSPNSEQYAELFGTTPPAVIQYRRNKLGIGFGKRRKRKHTHEEAVKWSEFLYRKTDETIRYITPINPKLSDKYEPVCGEPKEEPKEETKETGMNSAALYALLTSLAGSGAKLTVEICL